MSARRGILTSLAAAVTISLVASGAAFADDAPPPQSPASAAEREAATKWAQQLWKEAHEFATRNAGKARVFAKKADDALLAAKKQREDVETELAQAKARALEAKKMVAELEERINAAKAGTTRAAEDLGLS